ncbi:DoxX family protein [Aureibacillus halotolerans]|uniref:Thiosulfate dehydrogenase [quinone] large subunit n=1 Tax=Aureibacillus halotolerans TaxID=1508390 RepID=A0A4R6TW80_9BACI|nr:DoxX family protein [Aureibacillus halotolerans]TDQ37701.1 thiosulfate dehydrogenase [quinone] large subunit [Aureibacillus halotolerans]
MLTFLQSSKLAAVLLLLIRIPLGWMWFSSGIGKVTGGFDASGFLQAVVANPVLKGENLAYPLYVAFLESVAIPNAALFSFLVMWGEVFIGLGLMLGLFTKSAAFFGGVMNTSFLLAGTVSTNPLMLILAIVLLVSKRNAGRLGLDRYTTRVYHTLKGSFKQTPHPTEKPI